MRVVVGASDHVVWSTRFSLVFFLAGLGFALYSFGVTGWEELDRFRKLLVLSAPLVSVAALQMTTQLVFAHRVLEVSEEGVTLRNTLPFKRVAIADIDRVTTKGELTEIGYGKHSLSLINDAFDVRFESAVKLIRRMKADDSTDAP